jgi:hypothetical protein
VISLIFMSSRLRRQRRRNYYHSRGDAFSILPVPGDVDAGPVTRSQLEAEASRLASMGIYPVSPGSVIHYTEMSNPPVEFTAGGNTWVENLTGFTFNQATPGFFMFLISVARGPLVGTGTLGLRFVDTAGISSTFSLVTPAVGGDPQVYAVMAINNGWVEEGPVAGSLGIVLVRLGDSASSVAPLQADGALRVDLAGYNGQTGVLTLYGYIPSIA